MKQPAKKKLPVYIVLALGIACLALAGALSLDTGNKVDEVLPETHIESVSEDITKAPTAAPASVAFTKVPTEEPTASLTPTPTIRPTATPTEAPAYKTVILRDDVTTTVPYDTQYCGSRNSDVFHYIWCGYVKQIALHNFVIYDSREDAIAKGKRPCKKCDP